MTDAPWWRHVPDEHGYVRCLDVRHTAIWSQGVLALPDHDLESEAALQALGAGPASCARVAGAFEAAADPRRAGGTATSVLYADGLRRADAGPPPRRPPLPAGVLAALAMNAGLADRLLLTAVHTSLRLQRRGPWVAQAVARRAMSTFQAHLDAWSRLIGTVCAVPPDTLPDGAPGVMEMDAEGRYASLALPADWLWRVWAPGIGCVRGLFTLEVIDDTGPDGWSVRAVRWGRRAGRSIPQEGLAVYRRTPDGWTAEWKG